tara:strand:- start:3443 stop:5062 length:1620 start_codon:yes stop_codon:yes gene_type:complete
MLSFEELNKYNQRDDFLSILKEKLSEKRYNKIIQKSNYNKTIVALQTDLVNLQNWIVNNNKRLCVIFEGRDAAGKGGAIKRFVEHLNPRNSRVVALSEPTHIEKGQWYFQRYLKQMPNPGEMVFFDRSWYNRAIVEPVMGFCKKNDYELFMNQVNNFEKMLVDDGIILLKLWFSISKQEQRIRFINRLSNPLKTWKFSDVDMEGQKRWDIYTKYKEKMFSETNLEYAPWKIIDSNDKLDARVNSIKYVLSKFKKLKETENIKLKSKAVKNEKKINYSSKDLKLLNKDKALINLLSRDDATLIKTLRYVKFERRLKKLQLEMIKLQNWVYEKNKKVIVVFEGRDAAGKGGAIRRAIQNLNPRKLRVIALPKPSETEQGQWYFQRYVQYFPKHGEIVFFDRSWYNRAVVEPVNGFCSKEQYSNFMNHVNAFEQMIIDDDIILLKVYFSISKNTQQKRFNEIKASSLKKWKFTEVDGKAQKLWDKYTKYKDEMFVKTNTKIAPWNIISADRKIDARIDAINLILKNISYDKSTQIHSKEIKF